MSNSLEALETTGLPWEENNRTKITEMSMVAVKRSHLLNAELGKCPRVQQKLTLCFYPWRLIQPAATELTGLSNELLHCEMKFDKHSFVLIDTFLSLLTKPVCLIAHNGNNFDFPILKNNLEKIKVNFTANIRCADCYFGFYDILEGKKDLLNASINDNLCTSSSSVHVNKISLDANDLVLDKNYILELMSKDIKHSQKVNEVTPHKQKIPTTHKSGVKRRFPWSARSKPKVSYKLADIYKRQLKKEGIVAHRAENDCIMAMEIAVTVAKDFIEWVDHNNKSFDDVTPITYW